MANEKVFGSDITRTLNKLKNNLYDLLTVNPVEPLPIDKTKYVSCDFVPKTEKYFIPKRNPRPKVKTVRDIRNIFEKDVCNDLSVDIEKQQNLLLRKIRGGFSKDEKTKLLARSMLKSEKPISRTAWHMVININPDNYSHPSQYVLWNGKCIQVNGSRGGKSKFIYKYDLGERRASLLRSSKFKKSNLSVKKDLLKHSLNVRFKPGPLSRKIHLDDSYQKYNIGNTELVHLPKPGLEILTEYGKPLDISVANFLHNLRDESGIISDKWAEFAISALGTCDEGRAVQLSKNNCKITFDLSYKYDQRQLLMRQDADKLINGKLDKQEFRNVFLENEDTTKQEIQKMLDEMLISVEINIMEPNMYTGEDPPREVDTGDVNNSFDSRPKDKVKRKGQSELNRLDVTVIRLCDSQEKNEIDACRKQFCTLGCICDSLKSSYRLKNHCGYIECMFECRCDFNIYNLHNSFEDNIIPGLISLDRENNSKLSKEEQKFHQTVILSGEKSILLKSQRRNWKAPEKYADFYSNMCLKAKKDIKRILSVLEVKLNCANIEPWCMIHNLYKCFCKGRFTEKLSNNVSNDETKLVASEHGDTSKRSQENLETGINSGNNEATTRKTVLRPRIPYVANNEVETTKSNTSNRDISSHNSYRCARVRPYRKRKYSDVFYFNTNKKIMELEQNDNGLHKRMMEILKIDENGDGKKTKDDSDNDLPITPTVVLNSQDNDLPITPTVVLNSQRSEALDEAKYEPRKKSPTSSSSYKLSEDIITNQFTSPVEQQYMKLKAWLEPSWKMYRQRFDNGIFRRFLEPPKAGKIALYPWDFIMERYHGKKNLFLVTNQKPFRIFMAVDHRNTLFKNCKDIRSIEDLDKYPINIKKIITHEVDCLNDQLCVLRGFNFCWELVGSVKKLDDGRNSENDTNELPLDVDAESPQKLSTCTNLSASTVDYTSLSIALENNTEQSKWFVMTIENDFSEIQFYNRGFFVKYESIIKAINVARVSNKTVRLSSQKCVEGSSDPQFGIYAIPNANEYCVFIGPYEKNQPLGIETVKTTISNQKLKTRGVWITTNKVDNLQVIDNPLSFMAQINLEQGQILDDSLQNETIMDSVSSDDMKSVVKEKENNKVVKFVKPIKITRTNNFYHLTPSGFLKPIYVSPEKQLPRPPILIKKRSQGMYIDLEASSTSSSLLCRSIIPQSNDNNKYLFSDEKQKSSTKRPIAEIAPQVKVVEECRKSNNIQQTPPVRKFEGGMFVLKPEEINSRSLVNKICFTPPPFTPANNESDMDIENFLANSVECTAPTNDVFVISDDEDYCNTEPSIESSYKEVWIICRSVKKIGWIPGRQDQNGNLSFEFPGFKFTEFYPEPEAYAKITQVLARKVYIPDNVNIHWSVVKTKKELHKLKQLTQKDLNPDYVLTKKGLVHKTHVADYVHKNIKTYSKKSAKETKSSNAQDLSNIELDLTKSSLHIDDKSNVLIEEGEKMMSETILKQAELCDTLSNMTNDRRQQISDRLRNIINNCS